jgi:hypothetical protein
MASVLRTMQDGVRVSAPERMPRIFSADCLSAAVMGHPFVRARRVCLLLCAALMMGAYDLALTLTYATSVGMIEVNPLARAIMLGYNSPLALTIWKLATMALSAWIIYRVRHRRLGEFAAWVSFFVLLTLCLHWVRYVGEAKAFAEEYHMLATMDSARFVVMGEE